MCSDPGGRASGTDRGDGGHGSDWAGVGPPDDVAKVVLFLASSAAEYMVGQRLFINGGALMP